MLDLRNVVDINVEIFDAANQRIEDPPRKFPINEEVANDKSIRFDRHSDSRC